MSGLSLGANVGARGQAFYGSSSTPATASEAAFGPALAPSPGIGGAFSPTQPAGIALWVGLAGVAFLAFLYYSLPG